MSIEKSKAQMIARLRTERRRLEANLAVLTSDEIVQPNTVGVWSIKDVLAHLAEWESRMSGWVEAARRGKEVQVPDANYTWKQLHLFNEFIYQKHRDRSLEDVLVYFRETHEQFMEWVLAQPEEELMACGRYAFLGKGCIYDWLNAYAAHDMWGKNEIRGLVKARNSQPV